MANDTAGSVSTIVLGSALSTTVPGSQPNRTVITPATTALMRMPATRLVNPGGSAAASTVSSRKSIGPLATAVQVWSA